MMRLRCAASSSISCARRSQCSPATPDPHRLVSAYAHRGVPYEGDALVAMPWREGGGGRHAGGHARRNDRRVAPKRWARWREGGQGSRVTAPSASPLFIPQRDVLVGGEGGSGISDLAVFDLKLWVLGGGGAEGLAIRPGHGHAHRGTSA